MTVDFMSFGRVFEGEFFITNITAVRLVVQVRVHVLNVVHLHLESFLTDNTIISEFPFMAIQMVPQTCSTDKTFPAIIARHFRLGLQILWGHLHIYITQHCNRCGLFRGSRKCGIRSVRDSGH